MTISTTMFPAVVAAILIACADGFSLLKVPPVSSQSKQTCSFKFHLNMAPVYDPMTSRWEASTDDESSPAGYGPFGSLLRQGPVPFLQRLRDPDSYDQAVLKMMANEKMDRNEAQGNMDAYLLNPNDWALQKIEEKNGAPKFDYANANMDQGDLILTGIWSSILAAFVGRIAYVAYFGCDSICQEYHF